MSLPQVTTWGVAWLHSHRQRLLDGDARAQDTPSSHPTQPLLVTPQLLGERGSSAPGSTPAGAGPGGPGNLDLSMHGISTHHTVPQPFPVLWTPGGVAAATADHAGRLLDGMCSRLHLGHCGKAEGPRDCDSHLGTALCLKIATILNK